MEPLEKRRMALIEDHNLAWAEFKQRYPLMARIPGVVAFVLFTALGQSLAGLAALLWPILPWLALPLMFFLTTFCCETFVLYFSGLAHGRLRAEDAGRSQSQVEALQVQVKELEEQLTAKRLVVS